ncbi:hypothetical protein J120_00205 [candidate division TM6 bacterium JCVI TM6SC1]|uniref:Uncharacterized protein n=1 Tax=candidate division TM6 bacterium JCVI TM6SC1 TaxID=1306947 RepID=A0A0D2I2H9_9BACT|nr:hypothetical protein J120_00205 [candidate division TM6 bacterium JCVI TM6SC1]
MRNQETRYNTIFLKKKLCVLQKATLLQHFEKWVQKNTVEYAIIFLAKNAIKKAVQHLSSQPEKNALF